MGKEADIVPASKNGFPGQMELPNGDNFGGIAKRWSGEGAGNRTLDQNIKSVLLYRLSYAPDC